MCTGRERLQKGCLSSSANEGHIYCSISWVILSQDINNRLLLLAQRNFLIPTLCLFAQAICNKLFSFSGRPPASWARLRAELCREVVLSLQPRVKEWQSERSEDCPERSEECYPEQGVILWTEPETVESVALARRAETVEWHRR